MRRYIIWLDTLTMPLHHKGNSTYIQFFNNLTIETIGEVNPLALLFPLGSHLTSLESNTVADVHHK